MNIAILTPIKIEQDAILRHLAHTVETFKGGNRYLMGHFKGKFQDYQLISHAYGSKSDPTALATSAMIQHFNPLVLILAGIAGGVKDVHIGDVVVGTKYYGLEFGKENDDGFSARPESGSYSKELITQAQSVADKAVWKMRVQGETQAKVVFGPIASSSKVVASTNHAMYPLIQRFYSDTCAIEMEAAGLGFALQDFPSVRSINIRGISDLLNDKAKSDAGGSQLRAAENMAAFVFELLYQMDVSQFKIFGNMNIKELSKQVIELILPIVKMDAMKEVGADFKDATNTTVRELWKKVKPLLIEEYEELKKTPEDDDVQAAARFKLKRELEKREDLRCAVEELLTGAQKGNYGSNVNIQHSKNVIQGSSFSVGGDFHLGDAVTK